VSWNLRDAQLLVSLPPNGGRLWGSSTEWQGRDTGHTEGAAHVRIVDEAKRYLSCGRAVSSCIDATVFQCSGFIECSGLYVERFHDLEVLVPFDNATVKTLLRHDARKGVVSQTLATKSPSCARFRG
jgi:hypothetical protein